jgi:hypothetical protein
MCIKSFRHMRKKIILDYVGKIREIDFENIAYSSN